MRSTLSILLVLIVVSLSLLGSQSFKIYPPSSWVPQTTFISRSTNVYSSKRLFASRVKSTNREGEESTMVVDDDEGQATKSATESLTFVGIASVTSKEFPMKDRDTILKFLQNKTNTNLLMSAGGSRPVESLEVTSELLDEWRMYCDIVGSKYPNVDTDWAIATETSGINFVGLIKVVSKGRFGAKIVHDENDANAAPVFEVTGLTDSRSVTGFAPFVAIYKALTGEDKAKDNTKVSSIARVSYKTVGENGEKFVFTSDVRVNIKINFPAFLLKILPQGKEKTEEKGGEAVSKAVVKDVEKSIKAIEEAYEEYSK